MSEAPRIDWYPSDWIAGTRHLSLEERAVYHDVLMMIYEEHGALKEDYRRLARRIAIAPKRLERIVSTLIEEGKLYRVDGFLTNERAENELKKRENVSEKARASAKARWAKARWAKERRKTQQNQQKADADAVRSQCPADANHLPTANIQKKGGGGGAHTPAREDDLDNEAPFGEPDQTQQEPEVLHRANLRDQVLDAAGIDISKARNPARWLSSEASTPSSSGRTSA